MANKNVNILLKLQDQFTRPMREAGVITKDQEKAMRKVSQSVIGFSRNVRNGFLGGAAHVLKFGAALTGITGVLSVGALKAFASQSEELAKAQIDAETKLEAVLGNVKSIAAEGNEAIASAKSQLMSVASDIQAVGVIGDEVTLAGMQQLATFQLSADQIATLSTGMTDLLAQQKGLNASQEDAVSIANLIGKAMNGNAGALTRVGIIMTDNQKAMLQTGDATQRAAVLAEILADTPEERRRKEAAQEEGRRLAQDIFSHSTPKAPEVEVSEVSEPTRIIDSDEMDTMAALEHFMEETKRERRAKLLKAELGPFM